MSETHCIDERVNKRTLKTIYMQSMQFSYSITQTADEVFRTTTQQVFIEFLEALARVAIAKFGESVDGDGNESLAKIMRRLFEEHIAHMDLKTNKNSYRAKQKEEEMSDEGGSGDTAAGAGRRGHRLSGEFTF